MNHQLNAGLSRESPPASTTGWHRPWSELHADPVEGRRTAFCGWVVKVVKVFKNTRYLHGFYFLKCNMFHGQTAKPWKKSNLISASSSNLRARTHIHQSASQSPKFAAWSLSGWWYTYPTPRKNIGSSVGIMTFPINMKSHSKSHGSSHHQPDILLFQLFTIINHRLTIDEP